MHICKFFCLIIVHNNTFQAFDRVVVIVLKSIKFCSYNFVLNEVPNINDIKWVVNTVLNIAPNSTDAMCVMYLTVVDAKQFSMAAIQSSWRKVHLPETRDNDTITRKVHANGNKLCPEKEWMLYTWQFRRQAHQCGQAGRLEGSEM